MHFTKARMVIVGVGGSWGGRVEVLEICTLMCYLVHMEREIGNMFGMRNLQF